MNITLKNSALQAKNTDSNYFTIIKSIEDSPIQAAIQDCSATDLGIIGIFISFENDKKVAYPSQSYVADKLGVWRETINRRIALLVKKGIIEKEKRGWNSCIYKISPNVYKIADKIKHLIPALKQYLYNIWISFLFEKITPYISSYINNSTLLSNFRSKEDPDLQVYKKTGYSKKEEMKQEKEKNLKKKILSFGRKILTSKSSNMDNGIEFISQTLQRAKKELNLNKWGEIKLSAFSDEALSYAIFHLKSAKNVKNPFMWVFLTSKRYSDEHKIIINWKFSRHLAEKYEMPTNPETFYEPKKTIIPVATTIRYRENVNFKHADKKEAAFGWDQYKFGDIAYQ